MMNFYDPRLSAFACCTATDSDKDLIHAHEVQNLHLQTDLAVLSSCESGVGRVIEGENIIGLSRSFLAADAKNISYSVWKILGTVCIAGRVGDQKLHPNLNRNKGSAHDRECNSPPADR